MDGEIAVIAVTRCGKDDVRRVVTQIENHEISSSLSTLLAC